MKGLTARVTVKCVQTEKEVDVRDTCLADCRHFIHISYHGGLPVFVCSFPTYKEFVDESELVESDMKPEEIQAVIEDEAEHETGEE